MLERHGFLVLAPLAVFAALVFAGGGIVTSVAQEESPSPPAGQGRIVGKLYRNGGKEVVGGARVVAVHLDTAVEYASGPSDEGGRFELTGLPYGYFNLGVETPEGMFVANQVINVPPNGKVTAVFRLVPYEGRSPSWWAGRERREGLRPGEEATGIAEVDASLRGRDFWKSPRGIAVIAGGGGAVLLAIASGSDPSNPFASPSSP